MSYKTIYIMLSIDLSICNSSSLTLFFELSLFIVGLKGNHLNLNSPFILNKVLFSLEYHNTIFMNALENCWFTLMLN